MGFTAKVSSKLVGKAAERSLSIDFRNSIIDYRPHLSFRADCVGGDGWATHPCDYPLLILLQQRPLTCAAQFRFLQKVGKRCNYILQWEHFKPEQLCISSKFSYLVERFVNHLITKPTKYNSCVVCLSLLEGLITCNVRCNSLWIETGNCCRLSQRTTDNVLDKRVRALSEIRHFWASLAIWSIFLATRCTDFKQTMNFPLIKTNLLNTRKTLHSQHSTIYISAVSVSEC